MSCNKKSHLKQKYLTFSTGYLITAVLEDFFAICICAVISLLTTQRKFYFNLMISINKNVF